MAQKNASPNSEQARILEKNGLNKYEWVVVRELGHSMIVRERVTGVVKMIDK